MARLAGTLQAVLGRLPVLPVIVEVEPDAEAPVAQRLDHWSLPVLSESHFKRFGTFATYAPLNKAFALLDVEGVRSVHYDYPVHIWPFGDRLVQLREATGQLRQNAFWAFPTRQQRLIGARKARKQGRVEGWFGTEDVFTRLGADVAHARGNDGSTRLVCVIDTGIQRRHPAFRGTRLTARSAATGLPPLVDSSGHGTWCAASIGAKPIVSPNGIPTRGLTTAALLAIRALYTPMGMGKNSDILTAIQMAIDAGADVISMSLGSDLPDGYKLAEDLTVRALDEAIEQGIKVVVAAGNSGQHGEQTIGTPAVGPDVLTVGAVSMLDNGQRSFYSSYGPTPDGRPGIDVAAPGGGRATAEAEPSEYILAPSSGLMDALFNGFDGFAPSMGTSMATPFVAAIVALWDEYWEEQTGDRFTQADLHALAAKAGPVQLNPETGHGEIHYSWIDAAV